MITGPIPPPTGLVGPGARTTASHVYQVFDDRGHKLHGGSSGPDLEATVAYAKGLASRRGFPDPAVEVRAPDAGRA